MQDTELMAVPGVPECDLTEEMLEELPRVAPPAPWEGSAAAVIWLTRAGKAARESLPASLRRELRTVAVMGGMVQYRDTPVGAYHEVLAGVAGLRGPRRRSVISFMAVDSPASLVGGRLNWSLPKTIASFEGVVAAGSDMTASGVDWTVRAHAATCSPAIPLRTSIRLEQEWPDGRVRPATMTLKGRARLAVVTVEVSGNGSLSSWLRGGRHLGLEFAAVEFRMSSPAESVSD